jgi:hypothetical protein
LLTFINDARILIFTKQSWVWTNFETNFELEFEFNLSWQLWICTYTIELTNNELTNKIPKYKNKTTKPPCNKTSTYRCIWSCTHIQLLCWHWHCTTGIFTTYTQLIFAHDHALQFILIHYLRVQFAQSNKFTIGKL